VSIVVVVVVVVVADGQTNISLMAKTALRRCIAVEIIGVWLWSVCD